MVESALVISGTAAAMGGFFWGTVYPRSSLWGPVHWHGPRAGNSYAITFDDGPTPGPTDAVLDGLGELRVRATFFVIGLNARAAPKLLERMAAEGHAVANHSWDHRHWGVFRARRYWDRQIRSTDAAIEAVLGRRPAMFRPPMGLKTWCGMGAAGAEKKAVTMWTRRAVDGLPTTAERILDRLAETTRAGDVLLLHDGVEPFGSRDARPTIAALKPLISRLSDRGLSPVRLDELLGLPAYQPAAAP